MADVRLSKAAVNDIMSLAAPEMQAALEAIQTLVNDPEAGEPLHNPLSGSRWLGFGRSGGRVIYSYDEVREVCEVSAVTTKDDGKRNLTEAAERLANGEGPQVLALKALLDALRDVLGG